MPFQFYYGLWYIDAAYVAVIIAAIFSLVMSFRVKSTFSKYSAVRLPSGMTGAEAARRVLDSHGLRDVRIERVSGDLTDHFDPRTNVIRLSDSVYGASTAAAVGVAAHEAGHAVQHSRHYFPLKIRNAMVPITNIGSRLSTPLILLGIVFSSSGSHFIGIAYLGIALFSLSVLFQLLTLPTEFNASKRAITSLRESGMLSGSELTASKKVLSAAAMTYVAATAVAITQFLRLLSIVSRRDRR
ncbi:MAG: zinc metallopeptidase [Clostridia bacterium]|nr:zinc metallopeptidase [Clostridia bacterium]